MAGRPQGPLWPFSNRVVVRQAVAGEEIVQADAKTASAVGFLSTGGLRPSPPPVSLTGRPRPSRLPPRPHSSLSAATDARPSPPLTRRPHSSAGGACAPEVPTPGSDARATPDAAGDEVFAVPPASRPSGSAAEARVATPSKAAAHDTPTAPTLLSSAGIPPLCVAAGAGHVAACDGLLRAGMDPNTRDTTVAPSLGSPSPALSDANGGVGANFRRRGGCGGTALHYAVAASTTAASTGTEPVPKDEAPDALKCVDLLLEHRADANFVDAEGRTPLFFAQTRAACEALAAAGADVNTVSGCHQSALHAAAQAGAVEVLEWLASAVSPELLSMVDDNGLSAADHAARSRSRLTARLLRLPSKAPAAASAPSSSSAGRRSKSPSTAGGHGGVPCSVAPASRRHREPQKARQPWRTGVVPSSPSGRHAPQHSADFPSRRRRRAPRAGTPGPDGDRSSAEHSATTQKILSSMWANAIMGWRHLGAVAPRAPPVAGMAGAATVDTQERGKEPGVEASRPGRIGDAPAADFVTTEDSTGIEEPWTSVGDAGTLSTAAQPPKMPAFRELFEEDIAVGIEDLHVPYIAIEEEEGEEESVQLQPTVQAELELDVHELGPQDAAEKQAVITTLAEPASPGDTEIFVTTAAGFAVGDRISVGSEYNYISGFGSILLQNPLAHSWPAGTEVAKVEVASRLRARERTSVLGETSFIEDPPAGTACGPRPTHEECVQTAMVQDVEGDAEDQPTLEAVTIDPMPGGMELSSEAEQQETPRVAVAELLLESMEEGFNISSDCVDLQAEEQSMPGDVGAEPVVVQEVGHSMPETSAGDTVVMLAAPETRAAGERRAEARAVVATVLAKGAGREQERVRTQRIAEARAVLREAFRIAAQRSREVAEADAAQVLQLLFLQCSERLPSLEAEETLAAVPTDSGLEAAACAENEDPKCVESSVVLRRVFERCLISGTIGEVCSHALAAAIDAAISRVEQEALAALFDRLEPTWPTAVAAESPLDAAADLFTWPQDAPATALVEAETDTIAEEFAMRQARSPSSTTSGFTSGRVSLPSNARDCSPSLSATPLPVAWTVVEQCGTRTTDIESEAGAGVARELDAVAEVPPPPSPTSRLQAGSPSRDPPADGVHPPELVDRSDVRAAASWLLEAIYARLATRAEDVRVEPTSYDQPKRKANELLEAGSGSGVASAPHAPPEEDAADAEIERQDEAVQETRASGMQEDWAPLEMPINEETEGTAVQDLPASEELDEKVDREMPASDGSQEDVAQEMAVKEQTAGATNQMPPTEDADETPAKEMHAKEKTEAMVAKEMLAKEQTEDMAAKETLAKEETEDRAALEMHAKEQTQDTVAQDMSAKEETEDRAELEMPAKEETEDTVARDMSAREETEDMADLGMPARQETEDPVAKEMPANEQKEDRAALEMHIREETEDMVAKETSAKEETEDKAALEMPADEEMEGASSEGLPAKEEAEDVAIEEMLTKEQTDDRASPELPIQEQTEELVVEEMPRKEETQDRASQEVPGMEERVAVDHDGAQLATIQQLTNEQVVEGSKPEELNTAGMATSWDGAEAYPSSSKAAPEDMAAGECDVLEEQETGEQTAHELDSAVFEPPVSLEQVDALGDDDDDRLIAELLEEEQFVDHDCEGDLLRADTLSQLGGAATPLSTASHDGENRSRLGDAAMEPPAANNDVEHPPNPMDAATELAAVGHDVALLLQRSDAQAEQLEERQDLGQHPAQSVERRDTTTVSGEGLPIDAGGSENAQAEARSQQVGNFNVHLEQLTEAFEAPGFDVAGGADVYCEAVGVSNPPDVLVVTGIRSSGLLPKWNRMHPSTLVCKGDHILQINDARTPADMLTEMKAPEMRMVVRHYQPQFEVPLRKFDRSFGFSFKTPAQDEVGQVLRIVELQPGGALMAHNSARAEAQAWDQVVLPNMCVVAVDTAEGDCKAMVEILLAQEAVKLKIARAGVQPSSKAAVSLDALKAVHASEDAPGHSSSNSKGACASEAEDKNKLRQGIRPRLSSNDFEREVVEADEAGLSEFISSHSSEDNLDEAFAGWSIDITLHRPERKNDRDVLGIRTISGVDAFSRKLGLAYAGAGPDLLLVMEVADGLVRHWNEAHPEEQLLVGDHIVRVDEERTAQAMQAVLDSPAASAPVLRIKAARLPSHFKISLDKKDKSVVGFNFKTALGGKSALTSQGLLVVDIQANGALAAHNAEMVAAGAWDRVVLPDMCVVSVNNIEDDVDAMIRELKSSRQVELRISRLNSLASPAPRANSGAPTRVSMRTIANLKSMASTAFAPSASATSTDQSLLLHSG